MTTMPAQARRTKRLLQTVASLGEELDARSRAELIMAVVRALSDAADDHTGVWTAERSSLSLVIDAVSAHRHRVEESSSAAAAGGASSKTTDGGGESAVKVNGQKNVGGSQVG